MNAQIELVLPDAPVDAGVIHNQPDMTAAIRLCIQVSGRDQKGICLDLEIDNGHWTRMLNHQAHFPQDKLTALMDLCGNEIPLEWLAYQRRKGLHMLESGAERLLRVKDARIADLEVKLDHFGEFAALSK